MLFVNIKGHEKVKNRLIRSLQENHIAHAQLFLGKAGSANLALAQAYATYINCSSPTEKDACGSCSSCLKFKQIIHPDFHWVFPVTALKDKKPMSKHFMVRWRSFLAENPYPILADWAAYSGGENKVYQISKEESKSITQTLSLKAFEAPYKVMLVWLPELMHLFAANAILKILEEPPPKTIFLLVACQAEKLLATILSRTQILAIPELTDDEIQLFLTQEMQTTPERAKEITYLAQGNLNQAAKLNKEMVHRYSEWFQQWMRSCFKANYTDLHQRAEAFQQMSKQNQKSLIQYSLALFRECIIAKYADEKLLRVTEQERVFIKNFSKVLNHDKIDRLSQIFNLALNHLERNANAKMLLMHLSIKSNQIIKQ